MKTMLICSLLLLFGLAGAGSAGADASTGVQAVPSDQIKYPDASEVLNKTDASKPGTKTSLPVTKLVTTKPVPAQATPAATVATVGTSWYLKWSLTDEASARSWATSLGVPADVSADGTQWAVTVPATGDALKLLSSQAGKAVLIHK